MYVSFKRIKLLQAPPGCQIRKRRRNGSTRNRVARYWGVWVITSGWKAGEIISGPCTNTIETPEILREGFIEYILPGGLPPDLFM